MPVRTITLTTDAYDALAAAKEEGESFSAVVRRLTGARVRLTDFAGAWKGAPRSRLREIRAFLDEADRISRADLEELELRRSRVGQPR